MKAVGYARISQEDQSHNSLDNQVKRIEEYCQANRMTLAKIFIENGRSAFTFDRPEWRKLEAYIKSTRVQYLVVYHIDRFSRARLMDALVKLNEIETKLGVKVLTVNDPTNLDTKDFSVELIRTLQLMFSNNERNRIQERTRDGIYRSLMNGRHCNMAPFGYKNTRDEDGKPLIVPHPVNSKFVSEAFRLYDEGVPIAEIRRQVLGIKLRGKSSIHEMLKNPVYAGLIRVPAYKGQPEMDVPGLHEAIVPQELYYRIQKKLIGRTVTARPVEDVWLRGFISCHCGRKMTAGRTRGRSKYYWYYFCHTHRENIKAPELHQVVLEILSTLSFPESSIRFFRDNLEDAIRQHNESKGGRVMRANVELEKVRQRIKRTQEKYLLSPDVEPLIYAQVMADLRAEESSLMSQIETLTEDSQKMRRTMEELLPKLSKISEIFALWPLHQRQLFLRTLFPSGLWWSDGACRTAQIHHLFADKLLILKEKGLLHIEQSSPISEEVPPAGVLSNLYEIAAVMAG